MSQPEQGLGGHAAAAAYLQKAALLWEEWQQKMLQALYSLLHIMELSLRQAALAEELPGQREGKAFIYS